MHGDGVCLHLALQAVHLLPGDTRGKSRKASQMPSLPQDGHEPDKLQLDGRSLTHVVPSGTKRTSLFAPATQTGHRTAGTLDAVLSATQRPIGHKALHTRLLLRDNEEDRVEGLT